MQSRAAMCGSCAARGAHACKACFVSLVANAVAFGADFPPRNHFVRAVAFRAPIGCNVIGGSCDAELPRPVGVLSDRFKVIWIDATAIAAKMIDLMPGWD